MSADLFANQELSPTPPSLEMLTGTFGLTRHKALGLIYSLSLKFPKCWE